MISCGMHRHRHASTPPIQKPHVAHAMRRKNNKTERKTLKSDCSFLFSLRITHCLTNIDVPHF